VNHQTKYWSLTWNKTKDRKRLPHEQKLINFFNKYCTEALFQYEIGTIKGKEHIQGVFTLLGERQSKTATLKMFEMYFGDYYGLTLNPVGDRLATDKYVTKEEGRVKGPFKAGRNHMFDEEMSKKPLRHWQKNLFELLTSDELPNLKDRKVIWVQDTQGNTGKSWFRKWLDIGQNEINVQPLPVSNVDRLMSAVNIISKTNKVDVYTIDLTRTRGEDESLRDLFSAIEQIKNGYVVDVMYGKFNRAIFDPPVVIIFTNERLDTPVGPNKSYYDYLSEDRWLHLKIEDGELLKHNIHGSDIVVGERRKSGFGQLQPDQNLGELLFKNEEN